MVELNDTIQIQLEGLRDAKKDSSTDGVLLAQIEVFVIVIAVVAIMAALFLLVLLQLRFKKNSNLTVNRTSTLSTEIEIQTIEEGSIFERRDPYEKSGPPLYTEVMKAPERYPLSLHDNFTESNMNIPAFTPYQREPKTSWAQVVNDVFRPEVTSPHEDHVSRHHGNDRGRGHCVISVDEKSPRDVDVLPSYEEATKIASAPATARQSGRVAKQPERRVAKENAFTISRAIKNIVALRMPRSRTLTV